MAHARLVVVSETEKKVVTETQGRPRSLIGGLPKAKYATQGKNNHSQIEKSLEVVCNVFLYVTVVQCRHLLTFNRLL
jgi:hypothetical protein